MRTIKFRAWNGERMREVNTICFSEGWVDTPKENSPIEHFVLMQYTGLKDMHGQEIYEGDIVSLREDKIGLRFIIEQYKTGFEFNQTNWGARLYESAVEGNIKIEGNIYENP